MRLIRGLIGSELGSFLSITAVDAIESKIFQNRQPTRTQRASTHQCRCARAAGLAQLRIAPSWTGGLRFTSETAFGVKEPGVETGREVLVRRC